MGEFVFFICVVILSGFIGFVAGESSYAEEMAAETRETHGDLWSKGFEDGYKAAKRHFEAGKDN